MRIDSAQTAISNIGLTLLILISVSACTTDNVEEFVFRETMELELEADCGDDNQACKEAVEAQIEACMEQSDWRSFVNSDEDPQELQRFITEFMPCFKDPDGNPYFGRWQAPADGS